MNRYYTGIGSRETPASICEEMTEIARTLDEMGYTLRSGGAPGADVAFEAGSSNSEIFLPWAEFHDHPSLLYPPTSEAEQVSRMLFPHFPGISRAVRLIVSRNIHQVLGWNIGVSKHSDFIICWTKDGKGTGGTKYAMRCAKHFDIPVFNLYNDADRIKLYMMIEDIKLVDSQS